MRHVDSDILRLLSHMPLLDRLEAAAISGWSRTAVHQSIGRLRQAGLAAAVPHASEIIPPTKRCLLTAAGLHALAREEGGSVDALLRDLPVSALWQRLLIERLDAVAVVYRLASALSDVAFPIRLRWFRAMPADAAIELPDGRVITVVRQGRTAGRTSFSKRLWRLRQHPQQPATLLLLVPDEVRLRHAGRLLAAAPFTSYLALEQDAASAGPGAPIWHTHSGAVPVDLRTALDHTGPPGPCASEKPPARLLLPAEIERVDEHDGREWLLPSLLKPADKRTLDAVADWPWITPAHLGALMGLRRSRLSEVVGRLGLLDLVSDDAVEGRRRLAVTDRALAALARRDRASVAAARRRWSTAPVSPAAPLAWHNVSGSRSRQLLRHIEHTGAVHAFIAALASQARAGSGEVVRLDPPGRAARYFRHDGRLHSVQPDAFGVLRWRGALRPFLLEWERRAVRPVTMAARLAPYLRYFSSHRPDDDHGAQPTVLVVFDDELARSHFVRIARDEMARVGVEVPLLVSHAKLLEREGPLGRAWFAPGAYEPAHAFQSP